MYDPDDDPRPRVLHLLKWLPRGGIETWLTHVFAAAKEGPFRHEVLLMQDEIGPYETRVRKAGVPIHKLPVGNWPEWFLSLRKFFEREGPFTVFHTHVDSIVSGPATLMAKIAGVPVRIVHSHAARSLGADYQKITDKLRELIGTSLAKAAATRRIAISDMAMAQLAGSDWRSQDDCTILLYGFDYSAFRGAGERARELRAQLAITEGAPVIGHVGRFDSQKNHGFLLQAFAVYLTHRPDATLVLIGRGPMESQFRQQAAELGIAEQVIFAGGTDDVPAYLALFDIFVFPSFSEGLGIVVLEAQAAGTPVLMPLNMPQEVIVVEEGVTLLDLAAGPESWARSIAEIVASPIPHAPDWLRRVEESAFGIERCIADLNRIYAAEIARHA